MDKIDTMTQSMTCTTIDDKMSNMDDIFMQMTIKNNKTIRFSTGEDKIIKRRKYNDVDFDKLTPQNWSETVFY